MKKDKKDKRELTLLQRLIKDGMKRNPQRTMEIVWENLSHVQLRQLERKKEEF